MQNIGKLGVLFLSLALILTAIAKTYSVETAIQSRQYDGVTLYKALFFTSGPLAERIPTLNKVARHLPAEYKALENQMIKYIGETDPAFFDHFAKEIRSGDRVRVANEIKRANSLQKRALLAVTKNSSTQFARQVQQGRFRSDGEPQKAVVEAVEKDVMCVVVLIVALLWNPCLPSPPKELQGFTFERYVDEIVRNVR